ncbi:MAG: SIMPL domain-containing protein [Acetobacteraceae bacterium]|nr:SIMPL domain-containing protein [Acetobacteraceae bacterium]
MRFLLPAILACVLAVPALAQEQPGTITTHATARTRLANTVADVGVGVVARARTVAAVHKALSDGTAPLLSYLRGAGAERLRTEQVTLTPEMEPNRPSSSPPDRITGYTGHLRVSFRVPADKLADVLGGVLDKGANAVEDTTLLPRETEVEAARQDLATQAVRTAIAQAKSVAEAAGRRLGAVRQIVVDPGLGLPPRPVPMYAARAAGAAAAPIATEAGESEVAATVSVVVNLVEP